MDTMTTTTTGPVRVVGYVRVSTGRQADSGAGIAAQRHAIEAECAHRGWGPPCIVEEVGSGETLAKRLALRAVLDDLDAGTVGVVIVHKQSRLTRSPVDFGQIMGRAKRHGWAVIALDIALDMTTPVGMMIANVMASFSQMERELIGERTRDALAEKRAAGVRLGRPPVLSADVRATIRAERQSGATLAAIADRLNAEAVPTAHGGAKWHPATVRRVALSVAA
jgi:DNA invertase Pin-like site-specific DNA recombinase